MVDGMEPEGQELITAAAIARLAGVGRAAVSNWRKRYPGFPKPAGGPPNSPVFDRTEILTWLKETGKADQLATAGRTDGGTIRLASERSISDLRPGDLLARTMAALLPRSTAPDPAAHDPELPVIVDPACGTAAALMAVADRFGARVRLIGQDLDQRATRIAAFNLSGNSDGAPYEIHAGDSFTDSQLDAYLGKAAAVVCEPPLGRPEWPAAELTKDPRWEFGIPAPRDGELAWVQHCYAHLRPHGVAVVAVSRRTCVQPSGEHIRAALVRTGALHAVMALPKGMGTLPGADICLWVLRRPSGAPERAAVPMIDLSGVADFADVPLEFTAWRYLLDSGDPAVVRAVDRLELLDEGACLLPSRYLAHAEASADDLAEVTARLTEIYADVGRGLPRFGAPKTPTGGRRSLVALAELERVGALTIRARDDIPRTGDVLLRTHGRMPVVAAGTASDTGVAQVIEIDESRLDSHFVALFLREAVAALPVANTLGAINRDDLRRCRVPRMPLAEQRKYGNAFRRLTEIEQALAKLSALSAKVIEQTTYALTTGAVAPEYELPAASRPQNGKPTR